MGTHKMATYNEDCVRRYKDGRYLFRHESSDLIIASFSSEGMHDVYNWNIYVIEISIHNVYGLVINDVIILLEITNELASRAAGSL